MFFGIVGQATWLSQYATYTHPATPLELAQRTLPVHVYATLSAVRAILVGQRARCPIPFTSSPAAASGQGTVGNVTLTADGSVAYGADRALRLHAALLPAVVGGVASEAVEEAVADHGWPPPGMMLQPGSMDAGVVGLSAAMVFYKFFR